METSRDETVTWVFFSLELILLKFKFFTPFIKKITGNGERKLAKNASFSFKDGHVFYLLLHSLSFLRTWQGSTVGEGRSLN